MSHNINTVIVTNVPAPYRVPGWRIVSEEDGINLNVIYCSKPHIDTTLNAEAHGFPAYFLKGRYWIFKKKFLHFDVRVWSLLNTIRPDVVITTGFIPTYLIAFSWAIFHGIPHVVMTDGTAHSERMLSALHRLVRRTVYKRSVAFIGTGKGSQDLFFQYGIDKKDIYLSPLCIDNDKFDLKPHDKTVDFIFCGRFTKHKHPIFAMQVACEVAMRLDRRISIDFVGSGEMENEMRDFATRHSDKIETRFHGYVNQDKLPSLYGNARVFLFPTEWDPWGVVANEACAAGLPVIVSPDSGAAGELLINEFNSYILELNLHSWSAAAVNLLVDVNKYTLFSKNSKKMVSSYTFDIAARNLIIAIRKAII